MSEMVNITVNGVQMQAPKGSLLIDKLLDENIHIPHFCYHKSLGTDGNCRMCMVEIEGQKRPQIACDTPIKDGMNIKTKSENIQSVRKKILELELINHPIDCPTCDQAGECKLQEYYMEAGFYHSRIEVKDKNKHKKRIDLGANVMLDRERCVLCTRCVRFCKDIAKSPELGVITRSDHSYIGTFPNQKLTNPYAMNVVDLCPVGALTSKDFRFAQRVWFLESFNSICNGCAKGCNIYVDHRKEKYKDDKIFRFRPRQNDEVNGYFMCDEGRLSYHNENNNRLITALINKEEANNSNTIAAIFKELTTNSNILFLVGVNLSLEELENTQKLASAINAKVSAYSPQTYDENFQDDFLKSSSKGANQKAFSYLGIDQSEEFFKDNLQKADLVVVLDNSYFEENLDLIDEKKVISMFSNKCKTIDNSDIVLPIASFYEKSGTYINIDGIKQKSISDMKKNAPAYDITTFIETLKSMIEKGNI